MFPTPDPEQAGSSACVRHNLTGREILILNGLGVPCPPTPAQIAAYEERKAQWEALFYGT